MVNTYDWIIATADSSRISIIWDEIRIIIIIVLAVGPIEPIRVSSKWPAIMFADSRIDKVIGRINLLIDSIHTINGIRIPGVPWGTIWAIME